MHAEHALARRHRMSAAAVERAEGGFQRVVAAIAGRPLDRAPDLASAAGGNHARAHRRGRPARRTAGGAGEIEGVAGRPRRGLAELRGHGLPHDARPALAQRIYMRGIANGLPSRVDRAVHLGRHVHGLVEVLDADRHAVDRREWTVLPVARRGPVRCLARALDIGGHERLNVPFALLDRLQTAFEVIPWRVEAVEERRNRVVEAAEIRVARIVGAGSATHPVPPSRGPWITGCARSRESGG